MSPLMKKLSIAFGALLVVGAGWWYFRMPSPAVNGLARPSLVLMEVSEEETKPTLLQRGERPKPGVARPGATGAASRRERILNRRGQRPNTIPSGGQLPGSEAVESGEEGGPTTRPAFNREDWRRKRREAIMRRRQGLVTNPPGTGPGETVEQEEVIEQPGAGGDAAEPLPEEAGAPEAIEPEEPPPDVSDYPAEGEGPEDVIQ